MRNWLRRILIFVAAIVGAITIAVIYLLSPAGPEGALDSRIAGIIANSGGDGDFYEAEFVQAEEADWLEDDELVMGIVVEDQAYAYSVPMMRYYHVVGHDVQDTPVLATYCVLCSSGLVFDARVDGEQVMFDPLGLNQTVAVMTDQQTGSAWTTLTGEAIAGERKGEMLGVIPTLTVVWEEWVNDYPDTLVLKYNPENAESYARYEDRERGAVDPGIIDIIGRKPDDNRLAENELILGAWVDDTAKAYVLDTLAPQQIVYDTLADMPVMVIYDQERDLASAFSPVVGGESLTFEWTENGRLRDIETGSLWNIAGLAVEGELEGTQLDWVTSLVTEWYGWVAYHPDTAIYGDQI